MSQVFKVWLVGYASPRDFSYDCYGEGAMYAIGKKLTSYFDRVCEKSEDFSSSDFSWVKGTPSETDVVVYVFYSKNDSLILEKGGQAVHDSASGGTYRHSSGMICEVYLEPIDGAARFADVAAKLIFHEIMHNKLDASQPQTVADIHSGGGLAAPVISASSALSDANIKVMAKGLPKKVKQYTYKMRDSKS